MSKVVDRVMQSTTTEGTVDFVLSGSVTGFQSFVAGLTALTGDSAGPWDGVNYVCIQSDSNGDPVDVEVGTGLVTKNTPNDPTIGRTAGNVIYSTNGNGLVDFGSGTKSIYSAPHAEDINGPYLSHEASSATQPESGSAEISGWYYYDHTLSTSVNSARTSVLLEGMGDFDDSGLQVGARLIDDNTLRIYKSSNVINWTSKIKLIEGWTAVTYGILDFGTISSTGFYLGTGLTYGGSVAAYASSIIQPLVIGEYIDTGARMTGLASIDMTSATDVTVTAHFSQTGVFKMPIQIITP